MSAPGVLGTVSKAGRVLDLFSAQRPEWGVTEAARALELPKSSVHELLTTLAETGLLQRTAGNRYRIGWRVLALGRTLLDTSDVRAHAQPAMRTLASRFGATVHLATLDDGALTYIDRLQSPRLPALEVSAIGRRLPPHCTALGKALLADEPWEVAEELLRAGGLTRYTEHTRCAIGELRDELTAARELGVSRAREEAVEGLCCYAAAIRDGDGRAIAALSLSVTASEDALRAGRYIRLVGAAAAQVTRSLRDAGAGWADAALATAAAG